MLQSKQLLGESTHTNTLMVHCSLTTAEKTAGDALNLARLPWSTSWAMSSTSMVQCRRRRANKNVTPMEGLRADVGSITTTAKTSHRESEDCFSTRKLRVNCPRPRKDLGGDEASALWAMSFTSMVQCRTHHANKNVTLTIGLPAKV